MRRLRRADGPQSFDREMDRCPGRPVDVTTSPLIATASVAGELPQSKKKKKSQKKKEEEEEEEDEEDSEEVSKKRQHFQ